MELHDKLVKEYELPLTFVGNGSNMLVSDKGIRGVVVNFADTFNTIQVEGVDQQVSAEESRSIEHIVSQTGFRQQTSSPEEIKDNRNIIKPDSSEENEIKMTLETEESKKPSSNNESVLSTTQPVSSEENRLLENTVLHTEFDQNSSSSVGKKYDRSIIIKPNSTEDTNTKRIVEMEEPQMFSSVDEVEFSTVIAQTISHPESASRPVNEQEDISEGISVNLPQSNVEEQILQISDAVKQSFSGSLEDSDITDREKKESPKKQSIFGRIVDSIRDIFKQ